MRSARVRGQDGEEMRRVSVGSRRWCGEGVRVSVTGKHGAGRADFEALCSFLLGFCLHGQANIPPTKFQPYSWQIKNTDQQMGYVTKQATEIE